MEFLEPVKQSGGLNAFSPDGKYLAVCVDHRLVIRDVESMNVLQIFACIDAIQYIEWSSDSLYILCAMFKRASIQVWSLEQHDWTCKIDEGSVGLDCVRWCPDGRHILSTAEFQLRITIWSLVSSSISYIKSPKFSEKGCNFSHDGQYLSVIERIDCKDVITVFDCEHWHQVASFGVETVDAADAIWSPDDKVICVVDSCIEYMVLLYSADGRKIAAFSAYSDALGIKTINFSPSSQFLAIGSYDETVRILNHVTWKKICEISHNQIIDSPSIVVYKEVEITAPPFSDGGRPTATTTTTTTTTTTKINSSKYEIANLPFNISTIKADPEKPDPKIGIGMLAFSPSNKLLFSRNDNMPNVVFIFDMKKLKQIAVLHHITPIKQALWHPFRDIIIICTGNNRIYLWSEKGGFCVDVPYQEFTVQSMKWHNEGSFILLSDKGQLGLCNISTSPQLFSTEK